MKKFIIITSIFEPTEAVKKFAAFKDWHVVVVGDRKTPKNWSHKNVTYLSPEMQEKLGYEILKILPWNHYCRKMVGYLYAMSQGAEIIYDTDDDNIPLPSWKEPVWKGKFTEISGAEFINIYSYFTKTELWPRGFPLDKILQKEKILSKKTESAIGIWQFLADGDPDVDAIYRLTNNTHVKFLKKPPLVLGDNSICPINSQNTFFHKDAFLFLYLPAFVTFRFTDILRGFIAQPTMSAHGLKTGFGQATVFQERNPHDYMRDFESEIPMYLHTKTVVTLAKKNSDLGKDMTETLKKTYDDLREIGIVSDKEIELLKLWIRDLKKVTS